MKTTNDPIEAVKALTRQSCNAMHMINDLMTQVRELRTKHCYNEYSCPNGEFTSSNSPECLDEIMDKLIYMMHCEANCGVGQVVYGKDGKFDAHICEFDENCQPK